MTQRRMYVLGLNCYVYNAAACLLRDGDLVAAAHEERFDRIKHSGGFPIHALRYCLDEAGITIDDVDHVAFHWQPWHKLHRRVANIISELPSSLRFWSSHSGAFWRMLTVRRMLAESLPGQGRPRYAFSRVRHHVAHGASSFLVSPFDEAAVLTVDGSGEMASATLGVGRGNQIEILREIHYPHSLGYVYVALTHYLGFIPNMDEYKVMALAAYGAPVYDDLFARIIELGSGGRFRVDPSYFNYQRGVRNPWVSDKLIRALGPVRRPEDPLLQRHKDIAYALQKRIEDVVLHTAEELHRRTGLRKLCYAGGTALNSRLNGRLLRESPFDDVFINPAANDAGTCIGAASYVYHALLGHRRDYVLTDACLGPAFSNAACEDALDDAGLAYEEIDDGLLPDRVAELLADGKVVGWFQGRMEIGPRALGSRSILADPRRAEMKDIVNARVKHREGFRPFAPSVLASAAPEYFEMSGESPFMLFLFRIRPEKVGAIPAVAHVDETARVQTVTHETSPRFAALIEAFERRTGVPVVLNTSFNDMGEPIVCTPREAVACFRSTEIDALALGNLLCLSSGPAAGT